MWAATAVAGSVLAGSLLLAGCANPFASTARPESAEGSRSANERSAGQAKKSLTGQAAARASDRRTPAACGKYDEAAGQVESLLRSPGEVPPGVFGTTLVQWADEIDSIGQTAPPRLHVRMSAAAEALRWIERTLRRQPVQQPDLARAVEDWRAASQDTVVACHSYG